MADQQALHEFSRWVAGCSGNEKQEARTFIEKLMRAWGWEDSTEAEVRFEEKVTKGGAGRADSKCVTSVLAGPASMG